MTVVLPLVGFVAAIYLSWGWGIRKTDLWLLFAFYLISGFGITIGYHRLFTHNSFKTYSWLKAVFGICGSIALQGPILTWTAYHRRHHQLSDQFGDPHSPRPEEMSFIGIIKGLWHSHIGWLFGPKPDLKYVPDLKKQELIIWIDRLFIIWVILGLVIPTVIGWLVDGTFRGAFLGFLWGGPMRIFLVHHCTWSINSLCHSFGSKDFQTTDESRNNILCGIFGLGEGWHNNHHAFQSSARHGLKWWQIDPSWWLIFILKKLGGAWDIILPTKQLLKLKKI